MRYSKKVMSAVLMFTALYIIARLFIVVTTQVTEFTSLDALVGAVTGLEGGVLGALKYIERKGKKDEV